MNKNSCGKSKFGYQIHCNSSDKTVFFLRTYVANFMMSYLRFLVNIIIVKKAIK